MVDITYLVIVFLTTFVLAYVLGTSVLFLIDHKMNDISINMPKINIGNNPEIYTTKSSSTDPLNYWNNDNSKTKKGTENNKQIGGNISSSTLIPYPNKVKILHENSPKIINKFKQIESFESNNHSSNTYYKDPKQMTEKQKNKFKYRAKLDKMTLVDYQNWLTMYKDTDEELSEKHRHNLYNLLRVGRAGVTQRDLNHLKKQFGPSSCKLRSNLGKDVFGNDFYANYPR